MRRRVATHDDLRSAGSVVAVDRHDVAFDQRRLGMFHLGDGRDLDRRAYTQAGAIEDVARRVEQRDGEHRRQLHVVVDDTCSR